MAKVSVLIKGKRASFLETPALETLPLRRVASPRVSHIELSPESGQWVVYDVGDVARERPLFQSFLRSECLSWEQAHYGTADKLGSTLDSAAGVAAPEAPKPELRVMYDDMPQNPLWHDNGPWELWLYHGEYGLDSHGRPSTPAESRKHSERMLARRQNKATVQPVYGYDHGGLAISRHRYGDRWDAGQLGVAVIRDPRALRAFDEQRDLAQLDARLKRLEHYLAGACYSFEIEVDGETSDQLDGFYGTDELKDYLQKFHPEVANQLDAALEALWKGET